MPIKHTISIEYLKISIYNDTRTLLVTCNIVFIQFLQPLYSHDQPVIEMHDRSLLLRWKTLLPKICHFQIFNTTFKCPTLCIILITLFHIRFRSKRFYATRLFVKITTSNLNAFFLFIFKYWSVYMTEATLNLNKKKSWYLLDSPEISMGSRFNINLFK